MALRQVLTRHNLTKLDRTNIRAMFTELYDGSTLPAIVGVTASAAEINYNDITTLGTGAASKAVVLDASGNYAMPSAGVLGLSRGTLAATGTTSADAAVITQQVTVVTASDGTKGVALPAAAAATGPFMLVNSVSTGGANLKVYPVDSGNDNINALAEDAAFTMGPGAAVWFIPTSATQWYAAQMSAVTATPTELNYLDITTLGAGAASKAVVLDANADYEFPTNSVVKFFQLKDADDTLLSTTFEYINAQCDYTLQQMTPGAGFKGVNTIHKVGVRRTGGQVKTEIMIDLTDAKSVATDLDIIGLSGVSHIGQITAALNGTALMGKMTCLEVPVGGAIDIDLYAADEGTGAYDGLVTDLAETALVTAGGNWTLGLEKPLAAIPAANQYLYLTSGAATAGTYSAGKFLIEIWGY